MKKTLLIAASFTCLTMFAQNKPEDFRIENGQLYNIQRSKLWDDISWGYSSDAYHTVLVVVKILPDGSLYCDQEFYDTDRDTGGFLSKVDHLILKNYPAQVHIGDAIHNCRAFLLPNKPGDAVNTYDYGLPNTLENRKTLHTAVQTNTPTTVITNAEQSPTIKK